MSLHFPKLGDEIFGLSSRKASFYLFLRRHWYLVWNLKMRGGSLGAVDHKICGTSAPLTFNFIFSGLDP